jgi:hypothetical protein
MIIYTIIIIKESRLPSRDYEPFAFLPEINISQTPNLLQNHILHNIFPKIIPKKYIDQEMFIGKYQRYPLNKKMQKRPANKFPKRQKKPMSDFEFSQKRPRTETMSRRFAQNIVFSIFDVFSGCPKRTPPKCGQRHSVL